MKKQTRKCIACNGCGYVTVNEERVAMTLSQKRKALKLYKEGFGFREIQRKLKIKHPYTVQYAIKTANEWAC